MRRFTLNGHAIEKDDFGFYAMTDIGDAAGFCLKALPQDEPAVVLNPEIVVTALK